MLLPALSKARESAREITCVNNHKSVNLMLQMYSHDYNDKVIRQSFGKRWDGYNTDMMWTDVLMTFGYMPTPTIGKAHPSVCPKTKTKDWSGKVYQGVWSGRSYSTNGLVTFTGAPASINKDGFQELTDIPYCVWTLSAIRNSADTMLHADAYRPNEGGTFCRVEPWNASLGMNFGLYHNGNKKTVVGFVDGHVSSIERANLASKYNFDSATKFGW